jgi:hypothetical protein
VKGFLDRCAVAGAQARKRTIERIMTTTPGMQNRSPWSVARSDEEMEPAGFPGSAVSG